MISDIRNAQIPQFSAPARAAGSNPSSSSEPQDHLIRTRSEQSPVRLADLMAATATEAKSLDKKLPEHVEGEVLVKLRPEAASLDDGPQALAEDFRGKLLEEIPLAHSLNETDNGEILHIKLPPGMTTAEGIAAMSKDSRVAYASSNDILHAIEDHPTPNPAPNPAPTSSLPGDLNSKLWAMNNTGQDGGTAGIDINAQGGWAVNTGSHNGPIIAVIDTGIDYNHKTLKDNIWTAPDGTHGYNAITGANDPMDDHYHGTHCTGTIAGNGTDGVYGVNHQAQVMGAKFLSSNGGGTLADAIKAITFASDHGARITSNSWGGGGYNQALKDALASSPALHIFAAGNESNNNDANPSYPASYDLPNIVSVAALDRNGHIADFSNYGATSVDLAAPGVDIWSTAPGGKYKSLDGTSMATPHVSGAAGLIAATFPGISNDQIKARLLNSVTPEPELAGKTLTGGRLNLGAALKVDTVAPNAAGNFGVSEAKAGRVKLAWVASGDDGDVGQAKTYQLRISDKPIVDGPAGDGQVSFDQARPVSVAAPNAPGSQEAAQIDLPLTGQDKTWYFALKVGDGVGNLSPMSSASASVPAAKLAFEDNKDPNNWTHDGTWGQVDVDGRTKVWTDSPQGDYPNNANTSMTSKPISLEGISGAKLIFDEKHATEARYDKVALEASSDGQNWSKLSEYTGSGDWANHTIDLSAFDGKSVQVRFHLTSDASVTGDGFYLDNVVVAGGSSSNK